MSKSPRRPEEGVLLPPGQSGSRFFHGVLADTVDAYGDAFATTRFPRDPGVFKKTFSDALVRFEAARLASPDRVDIARFLTRRTHELLGFARDGASAMPLSEHLAEPHADLPTLTRRASAGAPGLVPEVPFEGRTYRGRAVRDLADTLRARHLLTDRAHAAIGWIVDRAEASGGALDLTGHRFAVLGASAELAPTASLLRAGADVLWVDLADPDRALAPHGGLDALAGAVVTAPDARDLLRSPREVAAAVRRFADDGPVHLGLFAYAPGAARELRLAASMDAIARSLGPDVVRSVALYISPTTPAAVSPEDRAAARQRDEQQPAWKKALIRVGALRTPGHHVHGDAVVARAIVTLQGPSYQAAQYLTKMAAAEVWATSGASLNGALPRPVTISANVAGITNTKSLEHPLFQAAFVGAPTFHIQIFDPPTTRALAALIMLHDVLNPDAPGAARAPGADEPLAARAAAALSQQVHGGVYSTPWLFEHTVRFGAVLGLARRPTVLLKKKAKKTKR